MITSPTRIKRISLADPAIAEALVVSPYQVVLNGKAPGVVSFLLWDESEQNQIFEVTVDLDILQLSAKLKEAFPDGACHGGGSRRRGYDLGEGKFARCRGKNS